MQVGKFSDGASRDRFLRKSVHSVKFASGFKTILKLVLLYNSFSSLTTLQNYLMMNYYYKIERVTSHVFITFTEYNVKIFIFCTLEI